LTEIERIVHDNLEFILQVWDEEAQKRR